MAKKAARKSRTDASAPAPKPTTAIEPKPVRFSAFVPSTDARVTICQAWKSLMQFREELLTNPRQDSGIRGWWSVWIGTMQRWLYGGGDWGDGYYGPGHRHRTTDAADCLASVNARLHAMFTPDEPYTECPGDYDRTILFPAGATYCCDGFVIDWGKPFPPIAERGPIIEWLESWLDRIQYTESTGHYPWEADAPSTPTVSVPPDVLAQLQRAAAAGVIESLGARDDDDTPAVMLPELKPHDRQAWQLATLHGMTQDKVATALNKEHGTTYTQGQVSRMIARAKTHAVANGLAEKLPGSSARPRAVDPSRLELGPRADKRKPRPSDMARANDDDE